MQTARALLVLSLLLPAAAALPGCATTKLFQGDPEATTPDRGDWRSTEPFEAPSFDIVWERLRLVLAGEGYRPDDERTHADERRIVTGWSTYLAPNRFEGVRRRVHAEIQGGAGGLWTVRIAVLKQRNSDIRQPMNPALAKWEDSGSEETRANLLVWKLSNAFRRDTPQDGADGGTDSGG